MGNRVLDQIERGPYISVAAVLRLKWRGGQKGVRAAFSVPCPGRPAAKNGARSKLHPTLKAICLQRCQVTFKMWHLYIVRCRDASLYTGIATDVVRRFAEHAAQGKKCPRYLRGKAPLELVFTVEAGSHAEAARLEVLVKRISKADKERLVKGQKALAALVGRRDNG